MKKGLGKLSPHLENDMGILLQSTACKLHAFQLRNNQIDLNQTIFPLIIKNYNLMIAKNLLWAIIPVKSFPKKIAVINGTIGVENASAHIYP